MSLVHKGGPWITFSMSAVDTDAADILAIFLGFPGFPSCLWERIVPGAAFARADGRTWIGGVGPNGGPDVLASPSLAEFAATPCGSGRCTQSKVALVVSAVMAGVSMHPPESLPPPPGLNAVGVV